MIKIKKLLVCEFITGGGLSAQPLPDSLVREGTLMRDALLSDLSELSDYEITTTHDMRLTSFKFVLHSVVVEADNFFGIFETLLRKTDYLWLIAPETNGILRYLTSRCIVYKKTVIGCNSISVINKTSSKFATFIALQKAGIPTINTFRHDNIYKINNINLSDGVIIKPDDGAGSDGLFYLTQAEFTAKADFYFAKTKGNMVMQPYQPGIPASMCLLCKDGQAWLLSANRQIFQRKNQHLILKGCVVNGLLQYWDAFEAIGMKIAEAMPQLRGYIGVDLIIDEENDSVLVVEINPRLTTSYAGLREAMGCNPAKIILDCLLNESFIMPPIAKNHVEVLI